MDRAAWLEWRRQGLGGTDISAIRGEHPWRSPWDVWLSKVHQVDAGDRPEFAIGRWLERPIGEWAAEETQSDVLVDAEPVVGPEPWMRGTPDFYLVGSQGTVICEVKTDLFPDEKWGEAPNGHIPAQYNDQVQWQLLLADPRHNPRTDVAAVAVYLAGARERRIYHVHADHDRQQELVSFGREWWRRHVLEGEPPEPDASRSCADGLALLHPEHNGALRVATHAEEALARDLATARQMRAAYRDQVAELENQLRAAIGDDEGIRFTGGRVRRTATNRLTVRIRE